MAAPHGKLFAAIVLGGAAFGAASCYLSHELGDDAGVRADAGVAVDAGRDAGRDLGTDLGADLGADLGTDAGCAPVARDDAGLFDCVSCSATGSCRVECACAPFCCFI